MTDVNATWPSAIIMWGATSQSGPLGENLQTSLQSWKEDNYSDRGRGEEGQDVV